VVKGYSDDYGHGVLDLRAALMPMGRTGFAMRDRRQGAAVPASAAAEPEALPVPDVPLEATVLVAGRAIGDAIGRGLSGTRLVVRDAPGLTKDSLPASSRSPAVRRRRRAPPPPVADANRVTSHPRRGYRKTRRRETE
jgi:hypothetical protein